jgi:peptidoglycan/xylan/chitin deacetylase (PgdA/CDA1 family)
MLEQGSSETSKEKNSRQETDLEQQSTLPMAIAGRDLAQQPTLPMAVWQRSPKQQPALPLKGRSDHHPKKMLRLWLPLLLCVLLVIGGVLADRAIIGDWLSHIFVHNRALPALAHPHTTLPNESQSSLIDSTTKDFMNDMLNKHWAEMWSMLAPDAQQLWQGEKDFIHFEQAKFSSLRFIAYQHTSAQIEYSWLNPHTTLVYSNVAMLHVSLQAIAPPGLLSAPSSSALSKGLFNDTLFALLPSYRQWHVLVAGPADLDAPILVPASPPAMKLLVPIFMYHHVSNKPTRNLLDYNLTVTTTDFDAQLTWLQRKGYHSITQTGLFDALYYGKALPAHPMILSFDDGYEDMYTDALPVLLAHHYRGVFYIITGMIGGSHMTWQQVRKLAQDGMQIGSHTIHHINVGQPPAWTSTQAELLLSKQTLETKLGQPVQFFCYPSGEPFHHDSVYEQQIVLNDLFDDGYVGATLDPFTIDSAIQDAQTPYQLPRIRVSGGESLDSFIGILNFTLTSGAERLASGY